MRFLSTRELRNRPSQLRELIKAEDVVLTANGKPVAVLVGVDESNLEEALLTIRQARAQQALSRMRRMAAKRGLDKLTSAEIDAEIRAVRSRRKPA